MNLNLQKLLITLSFIIGVTMNKFKKKDYLTLSICATLLKFISVFSLYFGLMGAYTYPGKSAGTKLLIFLSGLVGALLLYAIGEIIKVLVRDILLPYKIKAK